MKNGTTRIISTLAALSVVTLWGGGAAFAQQETVTQSTTTTPAATAPPATNVIVQQPVAPVATTTTTSAPVMVGAPAPAVGSESDSGYAPNRYLLASGLVVFGIPYVTSVIVAAQSDNSADHHLYVPIVGPWLDMGTRQGCAVNSTNCDGETTTKVMLGVDGVFQAIGALEIVGALLSPEHRSVTTVQTAGYVKEVTFTPMRLGYQGYGLGAFASF
jgi:hypothetical protein